MKKLYIFFLSILFCFCFHVVGYTAQYSNQSFPLYEDEYINNDHIKSSVQAILDNFKAHIFFNLYNDGEESIRINVPIFYDRHLHLVDQKHQFISIQEDLNSLLRSDISYELKPSESIQWIISWPYVDTDNQRLSSTSYQIMWGQHVASLKIPPISFHNDAFRKVKIRGGNGLYLIQGEVSNTYNSFGISIDDGHNVLLQQQGVSAKSKKDWLPFHINISLDPNKIKKLRMLNLSLYISDNNKQEHPLIIPLEYII